MPPIDTSAWRAAVSDAEPSGPDLEFDADFGALDRAAQGKPEQQYGATIIPAEEPDWKEVDALARGLLDRTRDLRVLAQFAVSRLRLGGLADYAEVLELTDYLLAAQWDSIHPRLDPEDDNDPTLRANALLRLGHPGWVMRFLRDLPLAQSPRLGRCSWRDIAVATGQLAAEAGEKPTEATVRATFQDSDPARVAAVRAAAAAAEAAVAAISSGFDAQAGTGAGPDLTDLGKLLHEMGRAIDRYGVTAADAAPATVADEGPDTGPSAAGEGGAEAGAAPGRRVGMTAVALTEVTSRADALRLLDLVCQYYQRAEPLDPVPLLIERARRLADRPFLEILRDLAPEGLGQARIVTGVAEE